MACAATGGEAVALTRCVGRSLTSCAGVGKLGTSALGMRVVGRSLTEGASGVGEWRGRDAHGRQVADGGVRLRDRLRRRSRGRRHAILPVRAIGHLAPSLRRRSRHNVASRGGRLARRSAAGRHPTRASDVAFAMSPPAGSLAGSAQPAVIIPVRGIAHRATPPPPHAIENSPPKGAGHVLRFPLSPRERGSRKG